MRTARREAQGNRKPTPSPDRTTTANRGGPGESYRCRVVRACWDLVLDLRVRKVGFWKAAEPRAFRAWLALIPVDTDAARGLVPRPGHHPAPQDRAGVGENVQSRVGDVATSPARKRKLCSTKVFAPVCTTLRWHDDARLSVAGACLAFEGGFV